MLQATPCSKGSSKSPTLFSESPTFVGEFGDQNWGRFSSRFRGANILNGLNFIGAEGEKDAAVRGRLFFHWGNYDQA